MPYKNQPVMILATQHAFCRQLQREHPALIFGTDGIELRSVRSALRPLMASLQARYAYQLIDIAITDYPLCTGRFAVNYLLYSPRLQMNLIVTVRTTETLGVPSLQSLFPSAGWLEREAYDLFGTYFSQHNDMRRILTDYGFSGHPLRKDFPLTGFHEVQYNDAEGRVTTSRVELAQELRVFFFPGE